MTKATDPVTAYAREVTSGREIASRLVRLACQRHLNDLEQSAAKGIEWRPAAAQEVIDFFAEVLCLPENTDADETRNTVDDDLGEEGRPFVLSPFQAFIAGSLFGWYTTQGYRRFRVAYVETAKGSGKTPFGAGLMLYLLVADGERGAQVFAAAPTLKQAQDAFRDAERMVEASEALRELIDRKVNNLSVLGTGSFFRPVSSEKRGLDGKRVHGALVDELHEHPSDMVTVKIRAGTKGRRNALILEITNSGFDLESVCWKHHDYSRQILEGTLQNESWFAFVCHLDACEACHAAGKLQPSDDCPRCDDWKVEGPHWRKANPNLGVSLSWQYLREQVREAIDLPSQRNMVRRLNFCQWTQQATVWITSEAWESCRVERLTFEAMRGREVFIGVDLSGKIDLSSVVFGFPKPMRREDGVEGLHIDRAMDVIPKFWMPEQTILQRAQEDKMPYPRWRDEGHLFATPGSIIDHDAIQQFIVTTVKTYGLHLRGIGVDQAGATAFVTRLQRDLGEDVVVEVNQGYRTMNDPSQTYEALVVSQNLSHDGNPVMAMCVVNMGKEENNWREIRPVKLSQRKRIDGGVALIDAIYMMGKMPLDTEPSYQMLVMGSR